MIPLSLIRQPAVEEERALDSSDVLKVLLEGFDNMGCSGDGDSRASEDEDEDNIFVVWEDPEMARDSGGVMVCCKDNEVPLEIEPLASLVPTVSSDYLLGLGPDNDDRDTSQPSFGLRKTINSLGLS